MTPKYLTGAQPTETWIVMKEHVWEHKDGDRPTLAYLLPSEFGMTTYPNFEAASAFIASGWPLGFVAMRLDAPQAPACNHRIADATNEHVQSGYFCVDCGALFASATPPPAKMKVELNHLVWLDRVDMFAACVEMYPDFDGESVDNPSMLVAFARDLRLEVAELKRHLNTNMNPNTTPVSSMEVASDEELTAIYDKANGHDGGKMKPITTAKIFAAMRACLNQPTTQKS